jgi:hypothetical protein
MWLFGAGTSASAGIPTATDMVWDFKQRLYVSHRRGSLNSVSDLSNPIVQVKLQQHVDSLGRLPKQHTPDEYAAIFEEVFPAERDRATYLDARLRGAKPSYGHMAVATLMRAGLLRLIWTTNFDTLLADACAKVFGTTAALSVINLVNSGAASQFVADERWPVEIRLHGDFQSRRLKNTSDETRMQDSTLRQVLLETCLGFGLIVVGYSGRDDSIMDILEQAIEQQNAFPEGFFWLCRGGETVLPRVDRLLDRVGTKGLEGGVVRIDNFDEVLRDIIAQCAGINTSELDSLAESRRRWSPPPRLEGRGGWPIVRFNAVPLLEMPAACRRIDCAIGGYSEVRNAVANAHADLIFARTTAGVLAFGSDTDSRTVFNQYGIKSFDLYDIAFHRLRYDSAERGLLREALARAVSRHRGLVAIRRHSVDLFRPVDITHETWRPLETVIGSLSGTIPGHSITWFEGVAARLDWANGRLCYLIEPRIVFEGLDTVGKAAAADFARERTARRYNSVLNTLLEFWLSLIAGDGDEIRAFGTSVEVDAMFRLSTHTGYSRRAWT